MPLMEAELAERLDRIIKLLELQTFIPVDQIQGCQHRNKSDVSVMGDAPMTKFYCADCGRYLRNESEGEQS